MKMKHQKAKNKRNSEKIDLKSSKCKLCYNTYPKPFRLREHQEKAHKNDQDLLLRKIEPDELKYNCTHCEQVFARDSILKYHIKLKHKEEAENFCKFCYLVVKKDHIKSHREKIHSDIPEQMFSMEVDFKLLKFNCSLCDKKFLTENSLIYHKFLGHIKKGENRCRLCMEEFKVSNSHHTPSSLLRAHFENIHSNVEEMKVYHVEFPKSELKYQCKKCSKSFFTENILKYHSSYGHKKDDLQCQVCNMNFTWSTDRSQLMKNHMKKEHEVGVKSGNETVFNFMKVFHDLKDSY